MKCRSPQLFLVLLFLALAVALPLGCGGGGGDGGGTTTTGGGTTGQGVQLSSTSTNIAPGQVVTITASVPGQSSQTVVFSTSGGTLTQTGPTTATFHSSAKGTFTITATSDANPTIKGTIKITVATIAMVLTPPQASLNEGQSTTFTAQVTGTSNTQVHFTATGGTVTQLNAYSARYTAPSTPGQFTLTATSVADASVHQSATILVNTGSGTNATVVGKVVSDTGVNVSGAVVQFLDVNGNVVASSTVKNGQLSASVPTKAVAFTLAPNSIPAQYYVSFEYKNRFYAPNIQGCDALLPTLSAGQTAVLTTNITLTSNSGPPPPPPDGCGM